MVSTYNFIGNIIYSFLVSFGVMLGASTFAGIGALVNDHPPIKTMLDIAGSIKIWAVAVALGGTFSSFEIIEKGVLNGEVKAIIKQASYVISALIGANSGYGTIKLIQECSKAWIK